MVSAGLEPYLRLVPKAPDRLTNRLARGLRRERRRSHLTQEQVAERAGINPRHYQKLEAGTANATLQTLEGLCRALSVDIAGLFGR